MEFPEAALEYPWFFDQLDPNVWDWTDELSTEAEAGALEAWRKSRSNAPSASERSVSATDSH
ncbi:MAG TPA: hypothetical protein VI007_03210 [bacterium]